jgi:phosphatidylserine/phosphatidylglycerophosphate/cardiolipin synthase-like enzyme
MWSTFRMPRGRGSALDVLERAARRGLDVRLIFWRPDDETASLRTNAFWGSPAHLELLARCYPSVNIRWDRAAPGYCQHQKTWLIDGFDDGGTSFIGGINLNPHSLVRPGHEGQHQGEHQNHDVYIEVAGPAVADVCHNFVQRWNEASERARSDGRWGRRSAETLAYPRDLPAARGHSAVQIQRTTHEGLYHHGEPPLGGDSFPIVLGEKTNHSQYQAAIRAAQRTIYLEHQYLDVPEIITALDDALTRGVRVVAMVPVVPVISNDPVTRANYSDIIARRARLASHERFTLCGMATRGLGGTRTPVYVHSKVILIDDEWASVGSCNVHHYSMTGNGELNAAYRDPASVRALRVELFREHLGFDTSGQADTDALDQFQLVAQANRRRHELNAPAWEGMAIALEASSYGAVRIPGQRPLPRTT